MHQDSNAYMALEEVKAVKHIPRGVELAVDNEKVRLEFILDDVLRFKVSRGGKFDPQPTFAVSCDEFGVPEFAVRRNQRSVSIRSASMRVNVQFSPFHLDIVRTTDGSTVMKSSKGNTYRYFNDAWYCAQTTQSDDAILGLGEKTGALNHKGRKLKMLNTDILAPAADGTFRSRDPADPENNPKSDRFDPYYMSIPFFYQLSAARPDLAAGFFFDNGYPMSFDFSAARQARISAEGGQLTEYIFSGPSMKSILSRYCQLTGRMSMPPLWTLGHHQCRWHDYTQQEWLELAERYREEGIPCDSMWLDIGYMNGYRVFTWDRERFPDIHKALSTIREKNFRAVTIVDPGVKYENGNQVFEEGREKNYFCKTQSGELYCGHVWPGRTVFPDFVKEDVRAWWGRLNAEHMKTGLHGIWNDMNEPATGNVSPYEMRFDRDGENASHERYRNQYGLLMAKGTYEGLKKAFPDRRPFVLSRAGSPGIQRYAANWTGDNMSEWSHLAMSVYMNCNLGLSGQPFVGSDVGGFGLDTEPELLVRWYQYGVFQPFFRNHAAKNTRDQYPWSFDKKTKERIREAIKLRYQLLPYIYTSFVAAGTTGHPVQRPLVFDYQDDPELRDNCTEFLFGPSLLVAPVLEEGARRRELYLPEGYWYCFHTGEQYAGGRYVTVDAPLNRCPVFVKEGTVLPTAAPVESTMCYEPEELTLTLYCPARQGVRVTSELYEDDGLTNSYESGEFVKTVFSLTRRRNQLDLQGTASGKGFPQFCRNRFRVRFCGINLGETTITNSGEDFVKKFSIRE